MCFLSKKLQNHPPPLKFILILLRILYKVLYFQISVAASGLVWAVTWHGSALVRLGVSLVDPSGTHWCEVASPSPEQPLSVVGVGGSIVWGVTRGGGVWFR